MVILDVEIRALNAFSPYVGAGFAGIMAKLFTDSLYNSFISSTKNNTILRYENINYTISSFNMVSTHAEGAIVGEGAIEAKIRAFVEDIEVILLCDGSKQCGTFIHGTMKDAHADGVLKIYGVDAVVEVEE